MGISNPVHVMSSKIKILQQEGDQKRMKTKREIRHTRESPQRNYLYNKNGKLWHANHAWWYVSNGSE